MKHLEDIAQRAVIAWAGVHDLMLPLARQGFHGLWIEMKKPRRMYRTIAATERDYKPSQQRWGARMQQAGYAVKVC